MNKQLTSYWKQFCLEQQLPPETPVDAFSFGDTAEMADQLGKLVLEGKKTGTSSGYELYQIDNDDIPKEGSYSIVLNGKDNPLCVIKNKKVSLIAFKDITNKHAEMEGEGDLSLAYWQKAHIDFLTPYYAENGLIFNEESLLVFEEFEVVPLVKETLMLKKPSIQYAEQILAYKETFLLENDSLDGTSFLQDCETVSQWLTLVEAYSQEETVPKGHAVGRTWLLVNQKDDLIGMTNLRLSLSNDYLKQHGGHIGYSIHPHYRGKGFGKKILALTLEKAKKEGLSQVLLTCNPSNLASRQIILANNGVFEKTLIDEETTEKSERYWLKIH